MRVDRDVSGAIEWDRQESPLWQEPLVDSYNEQSLVDQFVEWGARHFSKVKERNDCVRSNLYMGDMALAVVISTLACSLIFKTERGANYWVEPRCKAAVGHAIVCASAFSVAAARVLLVTGPLCGSPQDEVALRVGWNLIGIYGARLAAEVTLGIDIL